MFRAHSVIAGYPWFLDWGRDSMISFEGLLLIPKRYDIAREVLLTFVRDIKFGLVPNGYSGFDNRPLYNSVDASLLLFEQVNKYLQYTKDYKFIKENIYEKLKDIVENYSKGIDLDNNNIYIAEDGLLNSGTETTQNTWMDAKIGNFAVTPRNGQVVELNALWYNALKTIEHLSNKFGEKEIAENCKKVSSEHKKIFKEKFYNKRKKCLEDVLGDSKIRPNQLFALSTTYPIIKPSSEMGKNILNTAKEKLLTKYGLRTLAKEEEGYIAIYEGDNFKRDMSYHQGITWPWLLGLYYDSLKNMITLFIKKHNAAIDDYITANGITVISKSKFIEQDSITLCDESNNQYVLLDNVYVQFVKNPKGDKAAKKIEKGASLNLLVRYQEYSIMDEEMFSDNTINEPDPDEMTVTRDGDSYTASFLRLLCSR